MTQPRFPYVECFQRLLCTFAGIFLSPELYTGNPHHPEKLHRKILHWQIYLLENDFVRGILLLRNSCTGICLTPEKQTRKKWGRITDLQNLISPRRDDVYETNLQTPTIHNPPALSLCLSSIVDFRYSVGLLVFKILPMLFVSLLARFEHTRL